MNKFLGHLNTILTHKRYVFYYACKLGIPWRGLVHDMSKFLPIEFLEGVKYYNGVRSPIEDCKLEKGYSKAWLHHKAHNKHHFEYYIDNIDEGCKPIKIPRKYFLELVADYLGAGKAYKGNNFTFQDELEWWKKKAPLRAKFMHPTTFNALTFVFTELAASGDFARICDFIKRNY